MIHLATGIMNIAEEDFRFNGPIPLTWTRNYDSWIKREGNLGVSWFHNFEENIYINNQEDIWEWTKSNGSSIALEPLVEGEEFAVRSEKITYNLSNNIISIFNYEENLNYIFEQKKSDKRKYRLIKIERHRFNIEIKRDFNDKIIQIKSSNNKLFNINYNQEGNIDSILNENKKLLIQYDYDDEGKLIKAINALGKAETYEYNPNGYLIVQTNRNDHARYWEYENKSEEAKCTARWEKYKQNYESFFYKKEKTIIRDAHKCDTTHIFDGDEIIQVIDAKGNSEYWEYNLESEVIRHTDQLGHNTYYGYDNFGRQISITQANGAKTNYIYKNHKLVMAKNALDALWIWEYNDNGQLETKIGPKNDITRYKYKDDLLVKIIDANSLETQLVYNENFDLEKVILPDESEAEWTYNDKGELIGIKNPTNGIETYRYDPLGRVNQIQTPDGNRIQLNYDNVGQVVEAKDKHHHVYFGYSPSGKLTSRKENDTEIKFKYTKRDQLYAIVNEHKSVYGFKRDELGNILEESGFDGIKRQYIRNAKGQVTEVLTPDEKRTKYFYDNIGNLNKVVYHNLTEEVFSYNKLGQLVEAANKHAVVSLERDELGNILKESSNGIVLENSYNALSQRISMKSSLGADINFNRNKMGWVDSMNAQTNTLQEDWYAQIERNVLGLETNRNLPGEVSSSFELDRTGKPITHQVTSQNKTTSKKRYQWDANDRLTFITDELNGTFSEFGHDAFGNLASARYSDGTNIFKVPDEIGNLYKNKNQTDRKYGKAGELLEDEKYFYTYDALGFLLEKKERNLGGQSWKYQWTETGMLETVIRPDRKKVHFTYDALGRRLSKTYKGITTHFVWDGNTPLHEWQTPEETTNTEVNDSGELEMKEIENLTTWVFEDGTFIPSAKLQGNKKYSIITDYLGTPVQAYDEHGSLSWERELDIYGKVRKGNSDFIPFLYQGQYYDAEVEMAYNRFRYYSPESGGYISQDPIRVHGGFNLYKYVIDVNNLIDPWGLAAKFCQGSKRWRDTITGKFIKKPQDLSELVDNGKIDYPSLMEFKNGMVDWNPNKAHNQWSPSPTKFPSGGFKYDMTDGSKRYKFHGHGSNPDAPIGSNASLNPTTTIGRTGGDKLTTNGAWEAGSSANPNDIHIPITNSPF